MTTRTKAGRLATGPIGAIPKPSTVRALIFGAPGSKEAAIATEAEKGALQGQAGWLAPAGPPKGQKRLTVKKAG